MGKKSAAERNARITKAQAEKKSEQKNKISKPERKVLEVEVKSVEVQKSEALQSRVFQLGNLSTSEKNSVHSLYGGGSVEKDFLLWLEFKKVFEPVIDDLKADSTTAEFLDEMEALFAENFNQPCYDAVFVQNFDHPLFYFMKK